jgi:hypothetical protein
MNTLSLELAHAVTTARTAELAAQSRRFPRTARSTGRTRTRPRLLRPATQ